MRNGRNEFRKPELVSALKTEIWYSTGRPDTHNELRHCKEYARLLRLITPDCQGLQCVTRDFNKRAERCCELLGFLVSSSRPEQDPRPFVWLQ